MYVHRACNNSSLYYKFEHTNSSKYEVICNSIVGICRDVNTHEFVVSTARIGKGVLLSRRRRSSWIIHGIFSFQTSAYSDFPPEYSSSIFAKLTAVIVSVGENAKRKKNRLRTIVTKISCRLDSRGWEEISLRVLGSGM